MLKVWYAYILSTTIRQLESGVHLYVDDCDRYFSSLFHCPNRGDGCLLTFKLQTDLDKHVTICKTVKEAQENPTIIQTMFEHCEHPLQFAKHEGILYIYIARYNIYIYIY